MDHRGLPCPACRQPTDVIGGWPSVHVEYRGAERILTVDPGPYRCPHCHAQFLIGLLDLELMGDEEVPIIALKLIEPLTHKSAAAT